MKGIVLAGGQGTRLHPITQAVSKQLLPVYDKPMVYYPLSTLMLAGIRDILLITTPDDLRHFRRLLGDGSQFGLRIDYVEQPRPNGLAEALVLGADFVGADSVALVLGDNIFYGQGFSRLLQEHRRFFDDQAQSGCMLYGYRVRNPESYGVGETDTEGNLVSLVEKPTRPSSNKAITGLYLYDNEALDIARSLTPSDRGELEITDVNRVYLRRSTARLTELGRGFAWLDTGTHDSLLEAGQFVQVLEHRQGVRIACPEEIALRMGFISAEACFELGAKLTKSYYGEYVMDVARSFEPQE